ncbi:unnamed protein product [Rotaria sp. Silwood2]|nr:unnamed protein product [Rotaria sp. Silwood2]
MMSRCICDKIFTSLVDKLTVEPLSIECVLNTVHYPQLHSISFVNFYYETLLQHLQCDTRVRLLTDQITYLHIYISENTIAFVERNELSMLVLILSMGKHLSDFTFMQWLLESTIKISPFNLLSTNLKSSSLSKLTNDIDDFDECLYLLDRRLECLCTLIVYISEITNSSLNINNTVSINAIFLY